MSGAQNCCICESLVFHNVACHLQRTFGLKFSHIFYTPHSTLEPHSTTFCTHLYIKLKIAIKITHTLVMKANEAWIPRRRIKFGCLFTSHVLVPPSGLDAHLILLVPRSPCVYQRQSKSRCPHLSAGVRHTHIMIAIVDQHSHACEHT